MNEIFEMRNKHSCNLRQNSRFPRSLVTLLYHGTESISYLVPKVWNILPNIYENIAGLEKFKKAIKDVYLSIILVEFVTSNLLGKCWFHVENNDWIFY